MALVPKRIFSPGYTGFCRYHKMGTIEEGCPESCEFSMGIAEGEAYKIEAERLQTRSAGQ